ncbi:MAG: thymidylate synthase, partial [Nocardioides sp.]
IFDPASDYGETKDVPCNNWLHFLQRDGQMHLSVAVRANDAIWGFSGINFFEWSVLQELVANSVGAGVGELTWFVGSMHVYDRHYDVADDILRNNSPRSPYDFGVPNLPLHADIASIDGLLSEFMEIEKQARAGHYLPLGTRLDDPFLSGCAAMLQLYNMLRLDAAREDIVTALAELPASDLRVAAVEYFSRRWGSVFVYDLPLTPPEWEFLAHHFLSVGQLRAHREVSMAHPA